MSMVDNKEQRFGSPAGTVAAISASLAAVVD